MFSKKELDEILTEEVLTEEEENKHRFTKTIAFFLIIMTTAYLIIGYPLGEVIGSSIESKQIVNNSIVGEGFLIVFLGESYNKLKEEYLSNQDVEIVACLIGNYNREYYIEDIFIPKIIHQSFNSVTYLSCPEGTIGWLHSHPHKRCIASSKDLEEFKKIKDSKSKGAGLFMAIMCSKDEFNIYE